MANILGNDSLGLLPTKSNYRIFDEGKGSCYGDVGISSRITEVFHQFQLHLSISDKILRALCYVYDKIKLNNIDNSICDYLYYWLGNTLINNLNQSYHFNIVISRLYKILNENNNNNKFCVLRDTSMDFEHFKKIKLIFDYFKDYDKSIQDLDKHKGFCSQEYYDFFTKYVDNYKELHEECITKYQQNKYFCNEFRSYYDNKKHHELISWSCNLTQTLPEPNLLPGKHGGTKYPNELEYSPGVGPGTKVQQLSVIEPEEHLRTQASLGYNVDDLTPGKTITSDDKTTSITSKSINSVVSVAGILVPSYLAYKYTPAGNWIRKLLGGNTRTNHNPYADQELMENFSVPEDFYSERSRYNISYSPE